MDTRDTKDGTEPEKYDYEVGYGRPPKSGQFAAGHKRSGGRKRGSRNLRTIVEDEIFAPVTFMEGGRKIRTTKLAAIVRNQTHKAAMGDARAAKTVLEMAATYCPPPEPEGESVELNEAERGMLADYIAMKTYLNADSADG